MSTKIMMVTLVIVAFSINLINEYKITEFDLKMMGRAYFVLDDCYKGVSGPTCSCLNNHHEQEKDRHV